MRSRIYTLQSALMSNPTLSPSTSSSLSLSAFRLLCLVFASTAAAGPLPGLSDNYLPAKEPDDPGAPPGAADRLRDKAYLPAQIGGIVGAYAFALVLVACALLLLSKRRRDHINGIDAPQPELPTFAFPQIPDGKAADDFPYPLETPRQASGSEPTFSLPSHSSEYPRAWVDPVSPTSEVSACNPGVDIGVDQRVVQVDKAMAQQQLEDMYKYVMEHEDAKLNGVTPPAPVLPRPVVAPTKADKKKKPAGLDLKQDDKKESKKASFLSALRSPRKKVQSKGVSISSPIMTPMTGTFPRHDDGEEMNTIPPRHYAPLPPPPPPPTDQFGKKPMTPDHSPESTMTIDERLRGQLPTAAHSRNHSEEPMSATSERSTTPLVGLPQSPKPGARFPSLPLSPKPGQTFPRSSGASSSSPSAVRTGGALPLRAYDQPSTGSSFAQSSQTKQTVFERPSLAAAGLRSPMTAGAVPYSPYQPQTPCLPMSPSLVTKKDRKRMQSLMPKTPTVEMVQSTDETW